jgi:serine/threonine protein kinase
MAFPLPFGRYQLLRKLATGGMGEIFLARQAGTGGFEKLLVVKRILPHLSEEEEFIQMFFDEARAAAPRRRDGERAGMPHVQQTGGRRGQPATQAVDGAIVTLLHGILLVHVACTCDWYESVMLIQKDARGCPCPGSRPWRPAQTGCRSAAGTE